MGNNNDSEKIASVSSRLDAHLQVAEFVDKASGEEIKKLSKKLGKLTERVNGVETSIIILKNDKNTKKEYFIFIFKLIGLICLMIGSYYTLTKLGILNGAGPN